MCRLIPLVSRWSAAVVAVSLPCLLTPAMAQAPAQASPTISVTGNAEVLADPERASFVITIDEDASNAAQAGADNARAHTAVMAALTSAGARASELSNVGYTLEPRWHYSPTEPPTRVGYHVSSSIRVEVSRLERLGALIDAALSSGATQISQIDFEPSDPQAVRRQALALAVANARAEAEAMAKAAGGALGALEELNAQPGAPRPVRPIMPLAAAEVRTGAPATELQPPELRVEATVMARWRYRGGEP